MHTISAKTSKYVRDFEKKTAVQTSCQVNNFYIFLLNFSFQMFYEVEYVQM